MVGGLAQLLLVRGQIVAIADMAQVMAAVDVGSVALLIALLLYHPGARRPEPAPGRNASVLALGYTALLVVLGSCVLLGTFLAGALPGQ